MNTSAVREEASGLVTAAPMAAAPCDAAALALCTGADASSMSALAGQMSAMSTHSGVMLSNGQRLAPCAQAANTGTAASGQDGDHQEDNDPNVKLQLDPSELVLLDLLGSGAQAEVYRAIWWRTFGCSTSAITVAVKRLHGNIGKRAHACESLTRDIKHPNLVKCFEATRQPPCLFVSEYCAGGSLYNRLRDTKNPTLTWCQKLKILLDVAKGMEYLHSRKPCILHRDLKSCNVLLAKPITSQSDQPTAKVADFGLSRVLMQQDEAWMTRCVGTWRWMAPEVFSSNEYDEKIDVFSFGIVMFEVFTGEIPYADTWPLNSGVNPRIGLHIINGIRPNVQLVQSGHPTRAVQLMQKCWAGNPQERPDFSVVRQQLASQLELATLYSKVKEDTSV
mmetsp:Transcript_146291/g.380243  ORF Transcript_146291/g.380243 Transcript_146291/m.380243 type:complete len:392 (+) Transcript_146291:78-1253(+)